MLSLALTDWNKSDLITVYKTSDYFVQSCHENLSKKLNINIMQQYGMIVCLCSIVRLRFRKHTNYGRQGFFD